MKDVLRQLIRDIRTEKLRTFLTVFGIVWGTVAISLMLAFGTGLHKNMIKNTAGLGDRIVIAWPGLTSIPYEGLGKGRRLRVTEEDIAAVRGEVHGLKAISGEYMTSMRLDYGTKTLSIDVSGVTTEFGGMRNLIPMSGGRFVNPIDDAEQRRVIFLGDKLKENIFGSGDAVGKIVLVNQSPFQVIGVLQDEEFGSHTRKALAIDVLLRCEHFEPGAGALAHQLEITRIERPGEACGLLGVVGLHALAVHVEGECRVAERCEFARLLLREVSIVCRNIVPGDFRAACRKRHGVLAGARAEIQHLFSREAPKMTLQFVEQVFLHTGRPFVVRVLVSVNPRDRIPTVFRSVHPTMQEIDHVHLLRDRTEQRNSRLTDVRRGLRDKLPIHAISEPRAAPSVEVGELTIRRRFTPAREPPDRRPHATPLPPVRSCLRPF